MPGISRTEDEVKRIPEVPEDQQTKGQELEDQKPAEKDDDAKKQEDKAADQARQLGEKNANAPAAR